MGDMAEKHFSSSQVLQTKCGKCRLVCSVPPVSEESGSFYCGRCRPKETPNRSFEEAANKIMFPCAFGCGANLGYGIALEHEVAYCRYRTVVCPFVNCTSTSILQDLHKHIKAYHVAYEQKTPEMYYSVNTSPLIILNCITI
ncbi:unnamed protein product, partial [Callosobruchus maculatus]